MAIKAFLKAASLSAVSAIALSLTIGTALAQDKPVTLRFSHWSPPQHPMSTISVPDWVNAVEKASNGSIKIQVYPSGQLGAPADHYDMARDGVADITWANVGFQPGRFPIIQAIEMPWLYKDPQAATLAMHEWYAPIAEREMKDVKVCQTQVLFPSVIHSKKEFKSVDEFKGLKIRVPNATQSRFMSLAGAVLIPVPATQARDVIEKGTAEAVTFPWHSLIIFAIDGLLKYHLDVPFAGNAFTFMFNRNSYNKLSDNQKKILDAHCNAEWAARFMSAWNKQEADGRGKLAGMQGHVVYSPDAKMMADLRAAGDPVRKEWADSVRKTGSDPDQLWKSLTDLMTKYKAN